MPPASNLMPAPPQSMPGSRLTDDSEATSTSRLPTNRSLHHRLSSELNREGDLCRGARPEVLVLCSSPISKYEFPGRSYFVSLKSNRTLPPRSECSIASLIWDGLYVVVIGRLNLPEATTFVASVSAARIFGRYSS